LAVVDETQRGGRPETSDSRHGEANADGSLGSHRVILRMARFQHWDWLRRRRRLGCFGCRRSERHFDQAIALALSNDHADLLALAGSLELEHAKPRIDRTRLPVGVLRKGLAIHRNTYVGEIRSGRASGGNDHRRKARRDLGKPGVAVLANDRGADFTTAHQE
jgi:hypothetical protein